MMTLAIPVGICWFCALVATPRKPPLGNEVAELIYARLLGRQHRLVLVALIVTAVVFFMLIAQMPPRIDPSPNRLQNTEGAAEECVDAGRTCITRRADGTLHVVSLGPDGMWHVITP